MHDVGTCIWSLFAATIACTIQRENCFLYTLPLPEIFSSNFHMSIFTNPKVKVHVHCMCSAAYTCIVPFMQDRLPGSRVTTYAGLGVLLLISRTMASKIIYFGHITSYGESGFNSSGAVPAVELAVEHVNNNTFILAGYKLVSTPVMDSEVSYYSTVEMHLGYSIFAHVLHTHSNHTLPPPSRTPCIYQLSIGMYDFLCNGIAHNDCYYILRPPSV